jgi:hypothetical protein
MADEVKRRTVERRWLRAPELDTESEMVFRADTGEPSRPRAALDLLPDGRYVETGIGAGDRRAAGSSGSWTLEAGCLVLRQASRRGAERTLEIVTASADRLVIRRSSSKG